jgi:hypothetical protein
MSNPFCSSLCHDCNLLRKSELNGVNDPTPFSIANPFSFELYRFPHLNGKIPSTYDSLQTDFSSAIEKYNAISQGETIFTIGVRILSEQLTSILEEQGEGGVCKFFETLPQEATQTCLFIDSAKPVSYFKMQGTKVGVLQLSTSDNIYDKDILAMTQTVLDDVFKIICINNHPACLQALIQNGACLINQDILFNSKYKFMLSTLPLDVHNEIQDGYYEFNANASYYNEIFDYCKMQGIYYDHEIRELLKLNIKIGRLDFIKMVVDDFYDKIKELFDKEIEHEHSLQKALEQPEQDRKLISSLSNKRSSSQYFIESLADYASVEVLDYLFKTFQVNLRDFTLNNTFRREKDPNDQQKWMEICTEFGACVQVPQFL